MCTNVGKVIYMSVGSPLINLMGESVNTMGLLYPPSASHNGSLYWPSSTYDHHLHLKITFEMLTIKITVVITKGDELMQF